MQNRAGILMWLLTTDSLTNIAFPRELKIWRKQWGIASESPNSRQYEPVGYWRGPIWAPIVQLMITGIENAGDKKFSKDIAYCF